MGLLNKTRVYLCGGMQYINGRGWRENVTQELGKMGITTFNPYIKPFMDDVKEDEASRQLLGEQMKSGDYEAVSVRMRKVRNFDLRLCDISDFIVAHINPSVASWGSAEELVTSVRAKKPLFISIEGGKQLCPLWIMGMVPHHYIYNNTSEIVDMLKNIDSKEKSIDSERWRLLLPEYR
jgi:hypothetical protein